ncbi:MAG: hypothetical protein KY468_03220 [Armatimonadetes bacterium]|nr:hypothetical protein [Armatimonadota bacterium]
MKLDEFRKRVFQEFGTDLNNATPANVRDFLDRMQLSDFATQRAQNPRVSLNDPSRSYEEIVKDTFAKILKLPAEEAVPLLWVIAFELSFSVIEYQYGEALETLFQNLD